MPKKMKKSTSLKLKYASAYLYRTEEEILEEALDDYFKHKHIDLLIKHRLEVNSGQKERGEKTKV